MKKIISLFLTSIILCTLLSGCSIIGTINNIKSYTNYSKGLELALDGNGEYYTLIGIGSCKDKDIVIPSKHEGKPVRKISFRVFMDCTFIESIIIPSSVDYIGDEAFKNCSSLSKVTIPSSVKFIEKGAFEGCSSLEKAYFLSPNNWGICRLQYDSKFDVNTLVVDPLNENISNPSTAAKLLTSTYVDRCWKTINK